jgi:hypothetical protein
MMRSLLAMLVLAGIGVAITAHAETDADVAKKCQEMALKAHPPAKLPNTEATANLRQAYYKTCIDRGGKMDPLIENQQ